MDSHFSQSCVIGYCALHLVQAYKFWILRQSPASVTTIHGYNERLPRGLQRSDQHDNCKNILTMSAPRSTLKINWRSGLPVPHTCKSSPACRKIQLPCDEEIKRVHYVLPGLISRIHTRISHKVTLQLNINVTASETPQKWSR